MPTEILCIRCHDRQCPDNCRIGYAVGFLRRRIYRQASWIDFLLFLAYGWKVSGEF